jgi:copper chaperone
MERDIEHKGSAPMASKTVLVTGASGGIGKATALCLATMGAHLAITGRDRERHDLLNEGSSMSNVTLNVPDISCEHCERAITNALQSVEGIRAVSVDIPAKQVRVDYDNAHVNVLKMKEILQEEDYPVESVS